MMQIKIEYDVYSKIQHWVHKAKKDEISGLGKVVQDEDGALRVISAMLLPQRNGAAHTDIEADDMGRAMFLLKDTPGDLRFWWHSHVQMPTFWSGTDMTTMRELSKHGWFVSTVYNQKNESRTAFMQGKESGCAEIFLDALYSEILYPKMAVAPEWDTEFEKNVKTSGPGWVEKWRKKGQEGSSKKLNKRMRKYFWSLMKQGENLPEWAFTAWPECIPDEYYTEDYWLREEQNEWRDKGSAAMEKKAIQEDKEARQMEMNESGIYVPIGHGEVIQLPKPKVKVLTPVEMPKQYKIAENKMVIVAAEDADRGFVYVKNDITGTMDKLMIDTVVKRAIEYSKVCRAARIPLLNDEEMSKRVGGFMELTLEEQNEWRDVVSDWLEEGLSA